ncbi:hypothetical protein CGZ93_01620 [Enemella dayhoffiae]|uniref:histidine kinase n=1 Tax=Enemella dayhoffiae TaxID=2016507 RepID=A0A255HBW2_9ACTN|nr:hypothetical protein CGZ93_01620 [Enemella dayhoffiae]
MASRILLIEDSDAIRLAVRSARRGQGFEVTALADGSELEHTLAGFSPELVVLDVMLTARDTVVDRVRGLAEGADDHLVKPFAMAELVVRCRPLRRRAPGGGWMELGLAQHGSLAVVSVTDSGRGIPDHERERIFERMVRLRGEDPGSGSGLGLNIARGYAGRTAATWSACRANPAVGPVHAHPAAVADARRLSGVDGLSRARRAPWRSRRGSGPVRRPAPGAARWRTPVGSRASTSGRRRRGRSGSAGPRGSRGVRRARSGTSGRRCRGRCRRTRSRGPGARTPSAPW